MLHSWRQTTPDHSAACREVFDALTDWYERVFHSQSRCLPREPCLRRSLRALRLKADAVAWSSLRCVMSSCAQHLYTHLHSLSHRHPAPAAGRRTTPRPSLRSVVKSALVVPDVGRCGLASGSRPMLDGGQSATPHGTRSHTCRRLSLLCLLTS